MLGRQRSVCTRQGAEVTQSVYIIWRLTNTRSYVAALELRIEKLERRLTYARQRKASVAYHDPDTTQASSRDSEDTDMVKRAGRDSERKDSLANIRAAIHRKAARTRENSDINSLVSDFGFLYALIHVFSYIC